MPRPSRGSGGQRPEAGFGAVLCNLAHGPIPPGTHSTKSCLQRHSPYGSRTCRRRLSSREQAPRRGVGHRTRHPARATAPCLPGVRSARKRGARPSKGTWSRARNRRPASETAQLSCQSSLRAGKGVGVPGRRSVGARTGPHHHRARRKLQCSRCGAGRFWSLMTTQSFRARCEACCRAGGTMSSWRAPAQKCLIASEPSRGPPDLILCDYRLRDGENGIGAIKRLQSQYAERVPAVLITGDTAADRLQEARESGLILLHKPVAEIKLRATVGNLMRARVS